MMKAEPKNLRIVVENALHETWADLCERKRISQQAAIHSLLQWFLDQDDLVQSGIFGQIRTKPTVIMGTSGKGAPTGQIREPESGHEPEPGGQRNVMQAHAKSAKAVP